MFIKSSVLTIEQIYGGRWRLELPWFQRAYAWDQSHVGRLIYDLFEAMAGTRQRYSLGHMSLARPVDSVEASLVDGHQRSISLSMLIALLRDLIGSGPMAERLHTLIECEDGCYRLKPQPAFEEFFAVHVQRRDATKRPPEGDIVDLSPSEHNMIANRDHMHALLRKLAPKPATLTALAAFLLEKCVVIVDEVEDEEEARTLLMREEDRGLSPHSSELAKVTIVTAMPPGEQEAAGRLVEEAQALLSADDFSEVLSHILRLRVRKRSSRSVDGELKQLFQVNKTGMPFLNDELLPRARWMARINRRDIGSGDARTAISEALRTLLWLDQKLWMPSALHWLKARGEGDGETALFFQRLDRLSYILKIASIDPTEQEYRFLRVLSDIDKHDRLDEMESLAIESELLSEALDNLRSRTFYVKRSSALVLRRISINMQSDRDPGAVDGINVTVEHILPRKPIAGQQWQKDFPSEAIVLDYCNRIGNLAFLSRKFNNIAGNSDYVVKRLILAQAATDFVLAHDAQQSDFWTRATIEDRGERLIALLLAPWQLTP